MLFNVMHHYIVGTVNMAYSIQAPQFSGQCSRCGLLRCQADTGIPQRAIITWRQMHAERTQAVIGSCTVAA